MNNNSTEEEEVKKFSQIAEEWWNKEGKFKPLHEMNYLRVDYIKKILHDKKVTTILDIGCGGGILSESMAKCGYKVTGIDPSESNIKIAESHKNDLKIEYYHSTLENFAKKKFDVILCMEVVEHVADLSSFLELSISMLKKSGFIFISTINRTVKSYLQAIIGAEYLLRWLPRGTHQWKKFVTPNEIRKCLSRNEVKLISLDGMKYGLIHGDWELSKDNSVNYISVGQKIW
ncbi:MAG: bifunctional 2-polyprenyl-6-hydroxyphenol methylase/3-demethylubiquinol 3-O-methyltransferase UbiG [Rickettsiaceae bacterium H1]|nr:bifunctional 2-polyprenyl-6-hydroxyphenol methylase/3-demethylubiquinol 3-O-methyltransferase UbiG [Rickettsiaceae bacterium H1]